MTIGPATSSDIRNAMQRFDAELRDTADWKNWEDNNSYKFALIDDHGRRYPMKEVISMATGTPKADFSGGDEAIRFAKKL